MNETRRLNSDLARLKGVYTSILGLIGELDDRKLLDVGAFARAGKSAQTFDLIERRSPVHDGANISPAGHAGIRIGQEGTPVRCARRAIE